MLSVNFNYSIVSVDLLDIMVSVFPCSIHEPVKQIRTDKNMHTLLLNLITSLINVFHHLSCKNVEACGNRNITYSPCFKKLAS